MRVVDRGQSRGFAFEPCDAIGISDEMFGKDFQRDRAMQLAVERFVHFAHPARAERPQDLIRTDTRAGGECHGG